LSVFLFFAVSGYLIAGPHVRALLEGRALPDTRSYALRRLARIGPAYWVALTFLLVWGLASTSSAVTARGVVDHYLLINSEVPSDLASIMPIAWTLSVEVAFYLAVPLIAFAIRRRTKEPISHRALLTWIGVVAVVSAVIQLGTYTRLLPQSGWPTVIQYSLPAMFLFFAPGIALAVAEHRRVNVLGRKLPEFGPAAFWASVAGLAGLWYASMYLFVSTNTPPVLSSVGFAIASGLTLYLAIARRETRSISGRALASLGLISYGLYLWNWTVMQAILELHGGPIVSGMGFISWVEAIVVLLAITAPIAALSWSFIERPSIQAAWGLRARWARTAKPHVRLAAS
jgi:peptidoglycan/LPS O-acetylase OafA/YrhL